MCVLRVFLLNQCLTGPDFLFLLQVFRLCVCVACFFVVKTSPTLSVALDRDNRAGPVADSHHTRRDGVGDVGWYVVVSPPTINL